MIVVERIEVNRTEHKTTKQKKINLAKVLTVMFCLAPTSVAQASAYDIAAVAGAGGPGSRKSSDTSAIGVAEEVDSGSEAECSAGAGGSGGGDSVSTGPAATSKECKDFNLLTNTMLLDLFRDYLEAPLQDLLGATVLAMSETTGSHTPDDLRKWWESVDKVGRVAVSSARDHWEDLRLLKGLESRVLARITTSARSVSEAEVLECYDRLGLHLIVPMVSLGDYYTISPDGKLIWDSKFREKALPPK